MIRRYENTNKISKAFKINHKHLKKSNKFYKIKRYITLCVTSSLILTSVLCIRVYVIKMEESKTQPTTQSTTPQKKEDNKNLTQLVNRGIERKEKNEDKDKGKIIQAINKHIGGLLTNKGEIFYLAGKEQKVNPMLLAAIAKHETANGTSNVLKKYNNVAGINWTGEKNIPHSGRYRVFKDIDDSIFNLSYILNNYYIKENRKTIDQIGDKFCPLSDYENNKYGMSNESWIPNVTKNYLQILEDSGIN